MTEERTVADVLVIALADCQALCNGLRQQLADARERIADLTPPEST